MQTAFMAQNGPPEDEQVDYRFLLANERTFLAWIRTALSLQIAGLGVLQFLTHGHDFVRYTLGIGLVLAGSYVGLTGYLPLLRQREGDPRRHRPDPDPGVGRRGRRGRRAAATGGPGPGAERRARPPSPSTGGAT